MPLVRQELRPAAALQLGRRSPEDLADIHGLIDAAKDEGLSVEMLGAGSAAFDSAFGDHVPNPQCAGRMPGWPVGKPSLIARPRSTEDVARLVRLIGRKSPTAYIAVRDQGHSYSCQSLGPPGAKNTVMLDLSLMGGAQHLALVVGGADPVLHVAPGTALGDFVQFAGKHGLHVVHGDCPGVGVFGCYLHGCINIGGLTNLYGLGVDSIVGFTMVLMDGRVWNVSENLAVEVDPANVRRPRASLAETAAAEAGAKAAEAAAVQQDLWFAVRGAGSSFGIVTELAVRAHRGKEQPFQQATLQLHAAPSTIEQVERYGGAHPEKAAAYVDLLHALRAVPSDWSVNVIVTGGSKLSDKFENFWIELMDTHATKPRSLEPVAELILKKLKDFGARASWTEYFKPQEVMRPPYDQVWGKGAVFASSGLVAMEPLADEALAAFGSSVTKATSGGACDGCWCNVHRVGTKHREIAAASGTSLNPTRANAEFYLEMDCGAKPAVWPRCRETLRAAQLELNTLAGGRGFAKPWQYPNIANDFTADWEDYAWGSNKARLHELKRKYDPHRRLAFFRSIGYVEEAVTS